MNDHTTNDHPTNDHTTAKALEPTLSGRPVHRALAAAAALGLGLAALTGCSAQGGDQAASDSGQSTASQSAAAGPLLSLIHISEPTRRLRGSRMPSSA